MQWVRARDKAGRVLALPNQTPQLLERYGLTRPQVDREAWVVDRAGRKYGGAAAANRVLIEFGGLWRMAAAAYAWHPVRWIEDRLYRLVADNRGRLARWWSATPECARPDTPCS